MSSRLAALALVISATRPLAPFAALASEPVPTLSATPARAPAPGSLTPLASPGFQPRAPDWSAPPLGGLLDPAMAPAVGERGACVGRACPPCSLQEPNRRWSP